MVFGLAVVIGCRISFATLCPDSRARVHLVETAFLASRHTSLAIIISRILGCQKTGVTSLRDLEKSHVGRICSLRAGSRAVRIITAARKRVCVSDRLLLISLLRG
ncbi:hypothetical protein F4801DRAFT_573014 [Xylaria longipes]|nr:hypothetical protein F4801DRAFT_573014 [Xylaria longipes]